MDEEKRVCIVLYKQFNGRPRYAVLKRTKNWEGWELIKGHQEGVDPEKAACTEIREETGIDELQRIEKLDKEISWTYEDNDEEVHTRCTCFVAEAPSDAFIRVSENPHDEHEKGHFLNFRDARDILTYGNQRDLLEHVHERLE